MVGAGRREIDTATATTRRMAVTTARIARPLFWVRSSNRGSATGLDGRLSAAGGFGRGGPEFLRWCCQRDGFIGCAAAAGGLAVRAAFFLRPRWCGRFGDGARRREASAAAGAAAFSPSAIASSLRFNSWSSSAPRARPGRRLARRPHRHPTARPSTGPRGSACCRWPFLRIRCGGRRSPSR